MKRIESIVSGVSEKISASFKEKRINKALETALLNAEEELETAKMRLEEFPLTAKDMKAEEIVTKLCMLLGQKEDAEYTIKRLELVKKYLSEDV